MAGLLGQVPYKGAEGTLGHGDNGTGARGMPLLTAADHQHMEEEGYLLIPNAVQPEDLAAVVDGIWSHMGRDHNKPDSWYADPKDDGLQMYGFMRQMHTAAMWRVRQSPKIHRAFADLWGTHKLWINIDRCIIKPPVRADKPKWGATDDLRGLLHWDFPPATTPKRFKLFQVVVYLEDTALDQGTFQCVPGFHNRYEAWHVSRKGDFEFGFSNGVPMEQGLEMPTPIAGKAGDLLIWDSFTPHGHCCNTSSKARLAQFMTMWPATEVGHEAGLRVFWPSSAPSNDGSALGARCGVLKAERRSRIRQWREGLQTDFGRPVPERVAGQNDVPSCPLSPLGRRLLGLGPWPAQ